jgi:hypothetical protein
MSSTAHPLRFDRTLVSLEPRTTTNCLDVATMFYGRHLAAMLRVWAVVALPAAAIVYWLAWWHGFDARLALVAVYVATALQGVLVVLGSIPAVFGAQLRLRTGPKKGSDPLQQTDPRAPEHNPKGSDPFFGPRLGGLFFKVLALRAVAGVGPGLMLFSEDWLLGTVGFLVTLFPCGWIAARNGFVAEKAALAGLDTRLHDRHSDRVLREQSGDLYSRACWIVIYYVMLWAVVFVTVDFTWYLLAGDSPLVGRVMEMVEFAAGSAGESDAVAASLWSALVHDAFLQVELTAAGLLVFPIARLAWLFCYVDARVRRDCWDMQLQFAQEVNRLSTQG